MLTYILGAVTVSYFFCQSSNPKTLSASTLLGSIVGQVLRDPALEPSLVSFLEQPEVIPDAHAMPEEYINILLKVTPPHWRGIFVIDGLDEMPQEEVDDIFGQLHRLGEDRWVSILCSSRPTSACYTIARSKLDEMWTLSMETADRSEEIRAYLAAEISRWNAIRPLTTELNRLVEEQLLAGCQGMLLWLSLQIEDICPRYTQELRPDAEILDIIGNLPKDLPGAFDKALSRMDDGKYGSKLFELVASAEPPLSMDELRVAFNVDPGNTKWDDSTLFSSGKTLLSAYGGSLLDIDEEDLQVRFIHYSVLLHLTTRSTDVKTGIFHFDLSEAEMTLGAVCVTYLNYSIFESRLSTAQKVSFGQVPQTTARSVIPSEVSRKAFSLLAKHRRHRDPKIDLERLSYELQSERWRVRDDVHLFLDYARNNWLSSSRNIQSYNCDRILPLWRELMTNSIFSASLPSVSTAAAWALCHGHATLFQHYLHSNDEHHLWAVISAVEDAVSSGVSSIELRGEGLGWLLPLYLAHPRYNAPILPALIELGCQPFKPTEAKSPSPYLSKQALQSGARWYTASAFELRQSEAHLLFLSDYLDDPNIVLQDGSTILCAAIARGFVSLAFQLLLKGADPNGGHTTTLSPLQLSIQNGSMGLAQRLVEYGADITVTMDGDIPLLFAAIEKSNLGLFYALLLRDASLGSIGYGPQLETAYHRLCTRWVYGDTNFGDAAMEVIMQHGTGVNLTNKAGETPLMLAVKAKMLRLTGILLENKADPNIGDCLGARPLHYARVTKLVQHLLHVGANPDATTIHAHVTPLMVAAYHGQRHIVEALLDGGASLRLGLSSNLSAGDVSALGWQIDPFIKRKIIETGAGATAFHLCFWRLERTTEFLTREDTSGNFWNQKTGPLEATQLCSELILIINEFLKRGASLQPWFAMIGDVFMKLETKSYLSLDLRRALDLLPARLAGEGYSVWQAERGRVVSSD